MSEEIAKCPTCGEYPLKCPVCGEYPLLSAYSIGGKALHCRYCGAKWETTESMSPVVIVIAENINEGMVICKAAKLTSASIIVPPLISEKIKGLSGGLLLIASSLLKNRHHEFERKNDFLFHAAASRMTIVEYRVITPDFIFSKEL